MGKTYPFYLRVARWKLGIDDDLVRWQAILRWAPDDIFTGLKCVAIGSNLKGNSIVVIEVVGEDLYQSIKLD
jgi:hypothetical protein